MTGQGSRMLGHQKTADVRRMVLSAVLTMLPVLTYGALQAYLTIGLPQLLEENPTGILLDLNKMSWISMQFVLYRLFYMDLKEKLQFQLAQVCQRGLSVCFHLDLSPTNLAERSA